MPRIVDHEARRQHVAEQAVGVVCRDGIDALTTRSVAAASGYSTAVVSHYFAGMDDLLLATFTFASNRARARFVGTVSTAPSHQRLQRGLESLLAIGDDARAEWTVFLAFWGKAIALPALAEEQAARVRSAADRVGGLIHEQPGVRMSRAQCASAARQLLVAVQGISTYAVFDPEDWVPERQRRMLRQQVAMVLA
jgi:DNA-binding transcriptional regulator YbjK